MSVLGQVSLFKVWVLPYRGAAEKHSLSLLSSIRKVPEHPRWKDVTHSSFLPVVQGLLILKEMARQDSGDLGRTFKAKLESWRCEC